MNATLALTRTSLRLATRERSALFFNYFFPLIFFFVFGQVFRAGSGGAAQVVGMTLTLGILGNGLFGAGIRAVAERETGVLRRYKVAPISPLPILAASVLSGLVLYLPAALLVLVLAHFVYGLAWPSQLPALLLIVALGAAAFRAIGLIVAAVANSTAESNILVQLLYMPMLFLSGATFPVSFLPNWAQILSQFLPASYLLSGIQGTLLKGEGLLANASAAAAMVLTLILALFIGVKLFRWEKDEKLPRASKVWLLAVLFPFLVMGAYQSYSHDQLGRIRQLERANRRDRTYLVRGATIFVGDGKVIENGGVLIKNGKISAVYEGETPTPEALRARVVEGSGKTLMPGLIDVHVHLGSPGGTYTDAAEYAKPFQMERELAAYLYSGITAVKSVGDMTQPVLAARNRLTDAQFDGAELFATGPLFTAEGGHGTEIVKFMPESFRDRMAQEFLRTPKTAAEAQAQVRELKRQGVDGIKAVLESGISGMVFNRLEFPILQAIAQESSAQQLPLVVHTGDARDVADSLKVGVAGIEHGSMRDDVGAELFGQMVQRGVAYDPTLSVYEGYHDSIRGQYPSLDRPLVKEVTPAKLLAQTRQALQSRQGHDRVEQMKGFVPDANYAAANLKRAYEAGVMLVTGSDAGNPLIFHGPTVHRELQLWVQAGIPAKSALQAATYNAARLLRAENRLGRIQPGLDATMVLVEGNPLQDITATERIREVFFKGERVDRPDLLRQEWK